MKRRLLSAVMVISLTAASLAGCSSSQAPETKAAQEAAGEVKEGQSEAGGRKCRGSGRENIYNCHRCEGYVGSVVSAPSGRR